MPDSNQLKKVEEIEEQIFRKEEEIKKTEDHIREDEKRIMESEKIILGSLRKHPIRALLPGGFTARELGIIKTAFTRRFSRYKLIMTILATIGVVLVWRGIWYIADGLPVISTSLVSLFLGILILWLIKRYTDL